MIATNLETVSTTCRIGLSQNRTGAYRKEVRSDVLDALARGDRCIEVDCSAWPELDLILLSVLVECASVCEERGATFELINVRNELRGRIADLRLAERLNLTA